MTSTNTVVRKAQRGDTEHAMFTADSEKLVRSLDGLLGSRRATLQLLALASAAVLTAFPYDHRNEYLKAFAKVRGALKVKRIDFSGGAPREVSVELRDAALHLLLSALEHDHDGERTRILERLREATSLALSDATEDIDEWSRLLGDSHEEFLRHRLAARTDLN